MKTLLPSQFELSYSKDLWRIRMGLLRNYGSQKEVSRLLNINEANLSKILTGVVDCNCKLYWLLCHMAGLWLSSEILKPLDSCNI